MSEQELVEEVVEMTENETSERRMRLATRLENMGYQLHSPHKGWLITRISSVDSSPTLDDVEALVERLEEAPHSRFTLIPLLARRGRKIC